MKRLLSKECQNIVARSFDLDGQDVVDYYKNIIDEYVSTNYDIIERLTSAVEEFKLRYMLCAKGPSDYTVDENGFKTFYPSVTWEEGENGERTILFPFINLSLIGLDINKEVHRTFFIDHIELLHQLKYYRDALIQVTTKEKNNGTNELPELANCFLDNGEFIKIMSMPQIVDLYSISDDGKYHWGKSKIMLAVFAHKLYNTGKLNRSLSFQDLAKVFCSYFNMPYNPREEKSFQPDRVEKAATNNKRYFSFIH